MDAPVGEGFLAEHNGVETHWIGKHLLYLIGYIATIVAANWAIVTFVIAPVGFGLMAPAGVYFAGLAFGSFAFLPGQVVGKAWMTLLAVAALWASRRRRVAEPLGAEH